MHARLPSNTFVRTLLIMLMLASISTNAEEYVQPLPESLQDITTITADTLAGQLVSTNTTILIDVRTAKGRSNGYIEGSVHLADVDTNCSSLARVIRNHNTAAVFYCTSSKCGRSLNALKIAQDCNYRNVYWFRGGFEEWQNKGYPYVSANVPPR